MEKYKTPEEIYNELLTEYLSKSFPKERLGDSVALFTAINEEINVIIQAMEQYGKQQYSKAVFDCVENATVKQVELQKTYDPRPCYKYVVDKDSMLKLIKE